MLKAVIPSLIGLSTTIAIFAPSSALAISGFTGEYDPGNFTFSSSPAGAGTEGNDLVTNDAATGTVILYSPDNAFNSLVTTAATIDWTINITPTRAGNITFTWAYTPFDSAISDDTAYYLLNGTPTTIATNDGTFNTQTSGSPISLTVANGDTFGFRVGTLSNTSGSGEFTVNTFDFTPTPVPFDVNSNLGLFALATLYGGHRWYKRCKFNRINLD